MLRWIVWAVVLVNCRAAVTQDTQEQHQQRTEQTEPATGSRFRIVQSDIAARLTFRLDRYAGAVNQLVKNSSGDNSWESMMILPPPGVKTPDHARFQIFTSGMAVKFTFLIDNDTGRTWQLVKATTKSSDGTETSSESWQILPD